MANNRKKGWHGDSEEHREAANENRGKTNWWPLLFLPVAFFTGWTLGEAGDDSTNRQLTSESRTQVGQGGGPETLCVTPGANANTDTDGQ